MIRKPYIALALVLVSLVVSSHTVYAEGRASSAAPWKKECGTFGSGKQFVTESSLFCLRQQNQRSCHRQAQESFKACGFSGDYAQISQRLHAKMLVVWALTGARRPGAIGNS